MLRIATLILLVSLQVISAETVEELVLRSAKMISEDGVEATSELIHPVDLAKFREEVAPKITKMLETLDGRVLYWRYPKDPAERKKLADGEFYKKFVQTAFEQRDDLQSRLGTYHKAKVVGTVKEGPLHHVVVRVPITVVGQEVETLEIVTVKLHGGKPYLAISADIAAVARVINPE